MTTASSAHTAGTARNKKQKHFPAVKKTKNRQGFFLQPTEIEFTKYYLPETSSITVDETVSVKMGETLTYKIQIVFFPETPNLLIVKA
ncbi:MAG: hypothetical protein SOZ72_02060 [Treponema sp.]|nr:hypothetical protein [Treponema sp.]